ncbi:hypothetical protein C818_02779 [Lachnospiraceae bacterium MD308]|nr:hypothetical protein C818_02779 [Lachnospiraceae bacterium MD308]MCI8503602.1 Gfo/Idh/MocA family oxidoreductase [Dorea sp.]
MYRAGIIGCGKIAQLRHIPEYAVRTDVQLAGFYDKNTVRAKELAERYGAQNYSSYEEMLNDPEIDVVSVCTANHSHAEIAIAALHAGKHVLCEKPMAVTLKECERMEEEAQKSGKYLMIGHNQRLLRTHQEAKRLLASGEIGKLIFFQTNFTHAGPETWSIDAGKNVWFFDKSKAAFGAMADLGIHKTDLIRYLTGDEIVSAHAVLATLDKKDSEGMKIPVDDYAACIYRLKNGAAGTMTVGWSNYGQEDNSTILYGEKGVMKIYCDRKYSLLIEKRDGSSVRYELDQIQTNDGQSKSGVIDEFIDCIREKRESVIGSKEALKSMRAVFSGIEGTYAGN